MNATALSALRSASAPVKVTLLAPLAAPEVMVTPDVPPSDSVPLVAARVICSVATPPSASLTVIASAFAAENVTELSSVPLWTPGTLRTGA